MRALVFLIGLFVASLPSHASEAAHLVPSALQWHGRTYHYQVFVPANWTARQDWPIVLFLHGSGERGNDNEAQLSQGLPPWLKQHGESFPALVVIPQAPDGTAWNGEIEQMALAALDASMQRWHGDRRRQYLTGLSMGGYGAWQIALDRPDRFAAAAIICGGIRHPNDDDSLFVQGIPAGTGDPYAWVAGHIGHLPTWIFNGAIDNVVPPQESERMYTALLATGADVRYTRFPGVGHGAWPAAYAVKNLWPWLFAHRLATR